MSFKSENAVLVLGILTLATACYQLGSLVGSTRTANEVEKLRQRKINVKHKKESSK